MISILNGFTLECTPWFKSFPAYIGLHSGPLGYPTLEYVPLSILFNEPTCFHLKIHLHIISTRYFSAVSMDGKIMIMGGCDSSSFLDTAAVLDISSKQLIHAGKLNEQRVYSASCVLNDVVYVVGG